jgi:archaetidylinositol phosphate synthase
MVLDKQRDKIDPILTIIAKKLKNLNPNHLSWLSLFFALFAGIFFYFSKPANELINYYLYFAALFVFLNGLLDAIDGKVAKMSNKSTRKGDFLDHAIDRYGDVMILCGLALSQWNRYPSIGILAISGMLLTSYMGTQSQAIGYKRNYSGLLGRADRLFLLMIAPLIQHILLYYKMEIILNFYILEWILIYFSIIGNFTAIQRFYNTLRWINKDSKK